MIDFIEKIQKYIGVTFLTIFIIAVMIQIIARYLNISVLWTEEIATFSFVWAVFMGAALMVRSDEHFSFDFFKTKLSGKKKYVLTMFINVIMFVFSLYVFVYGKNIMTTFWSYNWYSLPDFKMGYVWLVLPVMSATMCIYIIEHIIKNVREIVGGR